jgi:hypothetical protein
MLSNPLLDVLAQKLSSLAENSERSTMGQSHPQQRLFLYLFSITFMLQAAMSVAAHFLFNVSVSTEVDSVEYIRTADNILAGHGFSIEDRPPWRPNAFRTPGPLLINIPLRVLSFRNDLLAIIVSRLALLYAAVLTVKLAAQYGLLHYAWLAATFFILMPSIFYYSLLPYSTEIPYAIASGLLFVASLGFLAQGNWQSLLLIGFSAMYTFYLRPAAQFPLTAYIVTALFIALFSRYEVRKYVLIASLSCLLGLLMAYITWGYRNYKVFGEFKYSTISGANLLHWNARAMAPYLEETAKQELIANLNKYSTILQRYSGPDQFVLSAQQAKAGMYLIFKYPLPFLKSHLHGVIHSFFVFSPKVLESHSRMLVITASILHSGLALLGILGIASYWKALTTPHRVALLLILTVGVVSTLTGGALFSPRFRIPLDVLLAVGCAFFVMRILQRREESSYRSIIGEIL